MIVTIHVDTETGQVTVDRICFDGYAAHEAPQSVPAVETSPEPESAPQAELETEDDGFELEPVAQVIAMAPPARVAPQQAGQPGDVALVDRVANAMARMLLDKQNQVALLRAEKNKGAA